MTAPPLSSPLHDRHEAAGARWADFGGWSMPLSYSGIVDEHTAVREAVGLFDVSHLGNVRVEGRSVDGIDAVEWLNGCLTADLRRIGPGALQYTLCCDDETGGVVDDLMAYFVSSEQVDLVPNASNTAEIVRRLVAAAPEGITVTNQHTDFAILAVQGPLAPDAVAATGLPVALDYMEYADAELAGAPVRIARAGYTGEKGYELVVPAGAAGPLWDALAHEVEARGGRLCGLGARDTLRTEMGYPLHGQDISPTITPVEARLGWAIGWSKPTFWGRAVLDDLRTLGSPRSLWGIRLHDRGVPRPHMTVRSESDSDIGEVTSGTFSPSLQTGIALALLTRGHGEGEQVSIDVRGRALSGHVVKPPFVPASTR